MSIVQYASPEYRYSDYDTEIMKDYDDRINTYNTALTEYQALAEPYQGLVDTYNTQIGTYNTALDTYKADADAYNAAVAEYNAGPRTEEYAGPASPGQFTGVVPIFEGGAAPVAPEDPGFSGEDVDAFVQAAGDRAQESGAANAVALAVMNDPTQTYRTTAGDVNLAGMSGFGSTAMGFALGGYVDSPFADPMKVPGLGAMGEITGSNEMLGPQQAGNAQSYMTTSNADMMGTGDANPSQQASFLQSFAALAPAQNQIGQMEGVGGQFQQMQQPIAQQDAGGQFEQMQNQYGQQGVGGQFEQMNQMKNQFGQQMAGMQGAPLENYRNYLNQVYTAPEMQSATAALGGALQGKVQDFVEMVDEAERAHFDVQDSYGFGGGDFQQKLLGQFQNQQQGIGSLGMFADGGMVGTRPPERGPEPQGMEKGGVPNPEAFKPEITETSFEYTKRPSYGELRATFVNDLKNLSDEEIQAEYGITKSKLSETIKMLDVQYTYGSTDGPEGQGERFTQTLVSAPLVLESERPKIRPGSEVVSTTTGMMGIGPDGNLVEYGTESVLNAERLARLK